MTLANQVSFGIIMKNMNYRITLNDLIYPFKHLEDRVSSPTGLTRGLNTYHSKLNAWMQSTSAVYFQFIKKKEVGSDLEYLKFTIGANTYCYLKGRILEVKDKLSVNLWTCDISFQECTS